MCGILGKTGQHSTNERHSFGLALASLAHRGPDDQGIYDDAEILLGHRRLSILDLTPSGHQPMASADGQGVLVFNGEIYNHIELRRELESLGHMFRGHSDTEVLLHALMQWGTDALNKLNGMWAFALWRPATKQLLLARDRFGVKPLYFARRPGGQLAFASEPKALLQLFPDLRTINESALLDFLGNNLLYANGMSFYKGIEVLAPAHFLEFNAQTCASRIQKYWDYPNVDATPSISAESACEQFDELLTDAVRLRFRSDVPVGLTLSGGLDSTGILAAATRIKADPLTCFTSVYGDHDDGEWSWAKIASASANTRLLAVEAPQTDWLKTMFQIAWHMDGPGYSPAVYPMWKLMQTAREERTLVLLEGQGADEALGGYPQYAVLDLLDHMSGRRQQGKLTLGDLWKKWGALSNTFTTRWSVAWLLRESMPALHQSSRKRIGFESITQPGVKIPSYSAAQRSKSASDTVRDRLVFDHSTAILPGLLHYGDAISMAHGIETRQPFMDYRLVEWMFRLPAQLRFKNNETKWVLREYLRRNKQGAIGDRTDKKGYPTPVAKWLNTASGKTCEDWLLAKDNPLHQWCDPSKIRSLIHKQRQGVLSGEHHLYKLLSTHFWISTCIQTGNHDPISGASSNFCLPQTSASSSHTLPT